MNKDISISADNRIRARLRSETGASISFALLLFLVCAAMSALILVAGTTAAGRMSNIAETDQSYYAVTSAADLVVDIMDGTNNSVSVFKLNGSEKAFNKPMYQINNADLKMEAEPETEADYVDEDSEESTETVTTSDNMKTILAKACAKQKRSGETDLGDTSWTVSISGYSDLNAVVTPEIDEDGDLTLMVSNVKTSNGYTPFRLAVQFRTEYKEKMPPVTASEEAAYKITDSYEVTWSLARMVNSYDAR